ncbi:MAG: glycosyltransferase family 4 protein [Ferruginibacter sp.]
MQKRLAIITTHPIQYNAPLFSSLAARGNLELKVFYTWGDIVLKRKYDPGFEKEIQWDVPTLEGYDYRFELNVSKNPGSHHFSGINNPQLIQAIQDWGADAVLVYGWSYKSHLAVLRYFHNKIPVFFRGDSTLLQKRGPLKDTLRSFFLTWVYRHIDKALYVGEENRKYYLKYGLKEDQLVFAPHAVDNQRFGQAIEQSRHQIDLWKRALDIAADQLVFLYAGKLDKNKNVGMLLNVFCRLNRRDVQLIIAGTGPEENQLKERFASHSSIHFLGFQNQSQMPLLYGMCNVFVLPSISETWGLGINEAMACGRAVLASSGCGAATDLIINGENGYVFNNGDEADLLNKMQIMCDFQLLKDFGQKSQHTIKDWNFEKTASVIESLFTE